MTRYRSGVFDIMLSLPEVTAGDLAALGRAVESGWLAPLGPEVDAFEHELSSVTGRRHVAAVSSGTAGLHLALLVAGVGAGDLVLVSDLTFAATVNAIRYVGATPVFIDSEPGSWNMDPGLLATAIADLNKGTRRVQAVIAVDLYGRCADYAEIEEICSRHELVLIEDAAEALGSSYRGRPAGSFGDLAVLSFNGNKIITTSGGGALLTDRQEWRAQAVHLATQARDPAPHYQHSMVGYNYRLSNLLAALGRSQLADLDRRVEIRRRHFDGYRRGLANVPGITFVADSDEHRSNRWLTTVLIDPAQTGFDRERLRLHLADHGIEARPVWKPMHLQPVFRDHPLYGGDVGEDLFRRGLCLPSGSGMTDAARDRVIESVLAVRP